MAYNPANRITYLTPVNTAFAVRLRFSLKLCENVFDRINYQNRAENRAHT